MSRELHRIADDITRHWREPFYAARPYIYGMLHLGGMDTSFGDQPAREIVMYFLSNAGTWRGPDARRVKAELRSMLSEHPGEAT